MKVNYIGENEYTFLYNLLYRLSTLKLETNIDKNNNLKIKFCLK